MSNRTVPRWKFDALLLIWLVAFFLVVMAAALQLRWIIFIVTVLDAAALIGLVVGFVTVWVQTWRADRRR